QQWNHFRLAVTTYDFNISFLFQIGFQAFAEDREITGKNNRSRQIGCHRGYLRVANLPPASMPCGLSSQRFSWIPAKGEKCGFVKYFAASRYRHFGLMCSTPINPGNYLICKHSFACCRVSPLYIGQFTIPL